MRRLDHIRRDRQIIVKEIGGLPVIGVDPTHRRRREENDIGTIFAEPGEDRGLIAQIQCFPAQRQEPAILLSQAPDQGRAQHPAMPGDADPPAPEIERRITHKSTRPVFLEGGASYRLRPIETERSVGLARAREVLGWKDQPWSARSSCYLFILERPGMSRRRASR